jgi:hypothetical protein
MARRPQSALSRASAIKKPPLNWWAARVSNPEIKGLMLSVSGLATLGPTMKPETPDPTAGRGPRHRADRLSAYGIGARSQHEPEMFLAHLRAVLDPFATVEVAEATAEKDSRWRPRLDVLSRERRGGIASAVAGGDRVHEVAKAASEADPADRDHGRLFLPTSGHGDRLQ